ncbi:ATP-binding protein [Marinitoga lauensis]|uniref:ATP-binding protein n=1 Tax=Marinitoga lauensis TaxID=2201189 RepID=UPI001404C1B9|nr:HAMP domain-containing sensor histidine kinase [Marinitoga lauensis]
MKKIIYIKTGIENDYVYFQIENNGEPIPEEEQNKIFSPFFTTKVQGTGLGLPICKKIIEEEHKGKLYLVKSDEQSTIFRFELPLN